MIIDFFLTFLVGMLDSIMVASINESAVSGVALVDQLIQLVIMIFSALAVGGTVVAGQYLGSDNREKARNSIWQMLWFMILTALIIMVVTVVFRHEVFRLLFGQITDEVAGYADKYLLICAASIPMLAVHQAGAAVFRTMGDARIPMWISLMMNILNFGGNAIFIFGLEMDTDGAGYATLLSRTTAALAVTILLLNRKRPLYYPRTIRWRPDGPLIRKILYVGIPNGVENGMFQLGKILLLSLVTTFGTSAITANAITQNVAQIQCIPGFAVNMAVMTVIARCVGYGDLKQVEYYRKRLLLIQYLSMGAVCIIMYLAMPLILKMYQASGDTASIAIQMVTWHTFGAVILWAPAFGTPAALRAAGDVTYPMVISMITMWAVRILGAYLLAGPLGFGAVAVWIAMLLDWAARILFFLPRWHSGRWISKKVV